MGRNADVRADKYRRKGLQGSGLRGRIMLSAVVRVGVQGETLWLDRRSQKIAPLTPTGVAAKVTAVPAPSHASPTCLTK